MLRWQHRSASQSSHFDREKQTVKRLALIPAEPPAGVAVHPNCARCMAQCCQFVSQEIDAPTTAKEIDVTRWYLMHPGVRIYVNEESEWFLQFESTCRFLGDDNLCTIYETRPQICRDLSPERCEWALGPGDKHYFTRLEEFDAWLDEKQRPKRVQALTAASSRQTLHSG
jgi:Fe-S-cluster containining protein